MEAKKLSVDDAAGDSNGDVFLAADGLPIAFGDNVQTTGPIAFSSLKTSEEVIKAMKIMFAKTCTDVENETSKRVFPATEAAQICLYNRNECRTETRQAIILNINAFKQILRRMSAVPALQMQKNPVTKHSVAVLEPM